MNQQHGLRADETHAFADATQDTLYRDALARRAHDDERGMLALGRVGDGMRWIALEEQATRTETCRLQRTMGMV